MTDTILDRIIECKRHRLCGLKKSLSLGEMELRARKLAADRDQHRLFGALSKRTGINVIAEFKKASPSKGEINIVRDPAKTAAAYDAGGAAAISVLTEEDFFQGSLEDLKAVRAATDLPILRKDFFVEEVQIWESAISGVDSILLIVAALSIEDLRRLHRCADSLGVDVVVEVHNRAEMDTALAMGAKIIGVNNRDLRTFNVSLDVSRQLIAAKPAGAVMVAESGISDAREIRELSDRGYDGFLVGESLMRSGEPASTLREFISGSFADAA